jgi:hypothetical protein
VVGSGPGSEREVQQGSEVDLEAMQEAVQQPDKEEEEEEVGVLCPAHMPHFRRNLAKHSQEISNMQVRECCGRAARHCLVKGPAKRWK